MKLSQIEPALLPIDKLPHLKFQVEAVETYDKIIASLNKRKVYLKELLSVTIDPLHTLSMYEQNERELLLVKTDLELAKTHTSKIQKEKYIEDVRNSFSTIIKEMDLEWANLIEKAESIREKKSDVDAILKTFDMVKFEENWELAVNFYVTLKNTINPPKEEKKLSKV
jgi:hypothetical protein